VQICLIVELFITIVESSLVLRQPAKENFEKALKIMESLSKKNLENKKLNEELDHMRGRLNELGN
jgi:hypothetical protein